MAVYCEEHIDRLIVMSMILNNFILFIMFSHIDWLPSVYIL